MTEGGSAAGQLGGKVAIVTGGCRGIGQGIATALARAGAVTIVIDQDGDPAEASAASIRADGGFATAMTCDVSDLPSVSHVVNLVAEEFEHVDILVNNAQALRPMVPLADRTPNDLALTLDSGIWGTFHSCSSATRTWLGKAEGASLTWARLPAHMARLAEGLMPRQDTGSQ
jgi:NAD(P)-dependent dehydrogenase (short-subunit alcohol dehydrogenase family)